MEVEESSRMETARSAITWRRPIKTALHQAVLDGRLHQVRLLVSKHGVNVDSKDKFGRTPLMLACMLENEEDGYKMVKIFLQAGAFLNVKDNINRSALSYSCMKAREEIVAKFLKEDILDINSPDNDGNTPLHHAALCGNPSIVKFLTDKMVSYGLQVDSRNTQGYTALLLACKYGHYASAHILLTSSQSSPTLRDNEFFLNAYEWVSRSSELHESLNLNRSRTAPNFPRFTRENTVYKQSCVSPPLCRHTKPPSHPLGQSLDIALRLPAIFSYFPVDKPDEHFIDGKVAREILLKSIDDTIYANQSRLRPLSRVSSVWTRSSYPGTPKLMAISKREESKQTRLIVPDLRTLFKLYSDQYQPPSKYASSKKHKGPDKSNSIFTTSQRNWLQDESRGALIEAA